jgi:hypothetical protein
MNRLTGGATMRGGAVPSAPTAKEKKAMDKREYDYRCEDDHRTMSRAAEIEGDKDRMRGVREHHRKVTKAHARIGKRIGQRNSSRA